MGFAGEDSISGFGGDDQIGGGTGKDILWGGGGMDGFLFAEAGKGNADKLEDFKSGKDWIGLDADVFAAIGSKLGKKEFQVGRKADDGNDFIIFKPNAGKDTGKLFYDGDGKGGQGQVLIAKLQTSDLDHHDFMMI